MMMFSTNNSFKREEKEETKRFKIKCKDENPFITTRKHNQGCKALS